MADLTLKDFLRQQKEPSGLAMDLAPIKKVLGPDHPEIDETQVGRMRLIRALHQKFGAGFRNVPEVNHAIKHYDNEAKQLNDIKKALGGRHGG